MNHRYSFTTLISLLFFFIYPEIHAQESSKLSDDLLNRWNKNERVNCIIRFRDKADLSSAHQFQTKQEKGEFVYNKLYEVARHSQKDLIDLLQSRNIDYTAFMIVNAVAARLDRNTALEISRFKQVLDIAYDPDVAMEDVGSSVVRNNDTEPEWGIRMIGADSVWTLGFRGEGVTIGGQDTGYDWEHPVLKNKYRGWDGQSADHDYNWHDAIFEINPQHNDSIADASANPCGLSVPFPCDDHNHGTHTMGTMVGSDSTNLIGVAPGAKWVACRNMDRGIGKPSTYIECFEFFLAPTDLNGMSPRPDLAPDVINNSWSCPEDEGCNESNWALMREAIINLKAAGVVVVVSAGNEGNSGCGSVARPPAMFEESFAVGATNDNDRATGFSSRGPVVIDSSFRLKPDVSAPGQNVRSCIRNGGYARFSGTSMAGPHVAGAVALIINANPELRGQVDIIESILKNSAVSIQDSSECFGISGLDTPNHIYGHGRIDVLKAVEMARALSSDELPLDPLGDVVLFPNPVSGMLNIDIKDNRTSGRLAIIDSEGRSLASYNKIPAQLDCSSFETGIYYVRIATEASAIIKKFVVAR